MKQDAQRTSPVSSHGAWMRQLDEPRLRFAAKSVYTCYEMHRRIVDMRKCLITQIDGAWIEPQAEQASLEVNDDRMIVYAS